jgi:hypothetical protein
LCAGLSRWRNIAIALIMPLMSEIAWFRQLARFAYDAARAILTGGPARKCIGGAPKIELRVRRGD